MKRSALLIVVLPALFFLPSCTGAKKKELDKRISLWHKDDIPYGTSFAYKSFPAMFPDLSVPIEQNESPETSYIFDQDYWDVDELEDSAEVSYRGLYVVVTRNFSPSTKEWSSILSFIDKQNDIVISAMHFGDDFLKEIEAELAYGEMSISTQEDTTVYTHRSSEAAAFTSYGYPGDQVGQYFNKIDSSKWEVLTLNKYKKVVGIRRWRNGGSITIFTEPLLFSNFFLLHKANNRFLTSLWDDIPRPYTIVWWDNYFRIQQQSKPGFSRLGVLMQYPALRWAVYTGLLLLALLLFSEFKRRQKIIPVVRPLENSSLDFVKTIGRLYYQHNDRLDLVRKMERQWKDQLRHQYGVHVSNWNEATITLVALKVGAPVGDIRAAVMEFAQIEEHGTAEDQELIQLSQLLHKIHKK